MRRVLRHLPAFPCAAALLLSPAAAAQTGGTARGAEASADAPGAADQRRLGVELAALGAGLELGFDELDELLTRRHARSPQGQSVLREQVKLRLLEALAAEAGLEVSRAELNAGWAEFDSQLKASGVSGGARDYLAEQGVSPETFREYLRLGILHERLTRRALGLAEDAPLTGEQQTAWLEDQVRRRGVRELPPPWADGVAARGEDFELSSADYLEHLRTELPREDVIDACYELLLEKRVRARLPDVSEEALARAVAAELDRRRAAAEANPKFKGMQYEALLVAQGLSLETLERDPAVRVAALSELWVERTHDDDDLRAVYAAEREAFDGRFGEGVEAYALLLKAARFANELNPRTFDEADDELRALAARANGLEDFRRLAGLHSEDAATRAEGGALGVVTRGASNVPEPVRRAVFEELARVPGAVRGTLVGPVRMQGACVLVCLGERRPSPSWETMARHVRSELRRRFLEESLHPKSVVTWLDEER